MTDTSKKLVVEYHQEDDQWILGWEWAPDPDASGFLLVSVFKILVNAQVDEYFLPYGVLNDAQYGITYRLFEDEISDKLYTFTEEAKLQWDKRRERRLAKWERKEKKRAGGKVPVAGRTMPGSWIP